MKYALGNMLNGAGSLNPDGLSLNLQFAADKTLAARKGPTPTFTRASTATFIGSNGLIQSSAINSARFDHDPFTLVSKGLLIEETRTNLVFPSDGLNTQTRTVTAAAHTFSFYGAGTVVLSGAHSATVVGTDTYPNRTILTFTPTAGSLTLTVTGSVTQAQLEVGSFPTSYIPTTTASVVRSADVCSITAGAFSGFYNQLEGTFFVDSNRFDPYTTTYQTMVMSNDGTFSNRISISGRSAGAEFFMSRLGATEYSLINTNTAIRRKAALAYLFNSTNASLNGSIGTDDTSSIIPTVTQLVIGTNQTVSSVNYYRKRLANSKLQLITT